MMLKQGRERRRAELRHNICQASDDVWNPVRCHYGLHRKDIEIRNQSRVCSLDVTNLFKETSAIESAFPHTFNSLTSTPLTLAPAPAATLPLIIRSYIPNLHLLSRFGCLHRSSSGTRSVGSSGC